MALLITSTQNLYSIVNLLLFANLSLYHLIVTLNCKQPEAVTAEGQVIMIATPIYV